jgi:hypothetical protein
LITPQLVTGVLLIGALLHAGCGVMRDEGVRPAVPVGMTLSASAVFADLERRLLDADSLDFEFDITAEGAFAAALSGRLKAEGALADLDARGTFGGTPVALSLTADGQQLSGGNAARTFSAARPADLKPALILGLTRMGLLHNLARLTAAVAPDRADGGVREWVDVRELDFSTDVDDAREIGLTFAIHVSGQKTAQATLVLDRISGLPRLRTQQVSFPGGTMNVVERYRFTR